MKYLLGANLALVVPLVLGTGPRFTTAPEGNITIHCSPGDANLSGLEVWRETANTRSGKALATAKTAPVSKPSSGRTGSALRVSENGRYLVHPDGKPFFWLGDTAWLLCQMTTREDAELYLKIRAQQGFTVIQAALVMGEERVGGTLLPNVYGDLAFQDGDPARPAVTPGSDPEKAEEYDYWDHVDYLVGRAAAHGLVLGVLPLFVGWGGDGYEDGPQYPTRPIDALKIRQQAYWSYLAGGYHTSGNTNTWNFGSYQAEGTQDWKAALHSPGADGLSVLKRIFTSLEWWEFVPDATVFAAGEGEGGTRNATMRSAAGNGNRRPYRRARHRTGPGNALPVRLSGPVQTGLETYRHLHAARPFGRGRQPVVRVP